MAGVKCSCNACCRSLLSIYEGILTPSQYGKRYGKDNETNAEQGVAATQATNQAIALKPTSRD